MPTHHASTAILRVNSDDGKRFIFQRKDDGYPVVGYRGSFCLFGGTWTNIEDKKPSDTLLRELEEEFIGDGQEYVQENREFVDAISSGMQPYGHFIIHVPADVSRTRKHINFIASIFEGCVPDEYYRKNKDRFHYPNRIPTTEGRTEILHESNISCQYRYAYYEQLLDEYFKNLGLQANIAFHNGVYNVHLETDPDLAYVQQNTSTFIINPLKSSVDDVSVFSTSAARNLPA